MALNIEQKKAVVAEVAEVAGTALAAVAAEYRGLTVEEMTELRVKAREGGVFLRVAKNTLVRRAVEGTEFECMQRPGTLMSGYLESAGVRQPSRGRAARECHVTRWFRSAGSAAVTVVPFGRGRRHVTGEFGSESAPLPPSAG